MDKGKEIDPEIKRKIPDIDPKIKRKIPDIDSDMDLSKKEE